MRLIDADRLKEKMSTTLEVLKHIFPPGEQEVHLMSAFATVGTMADDCPTIEAVPVKHAKLVNPNPYGECSICGYLIDIRQVYNYCPNCGAKMDGGKDDV